MISLSELKIKSASRKIDISILERDYVISWVLKGIFDNTLLKEKLVFKGGTALRKVYFPDYRFSEDLDFTARKGLIELGKVQISESLEDICGKVYAESGVELTLADFKQTRDQFDEEAFLGKIQYVGPRGHRAGNPPRVRLDVTFYEEVVFQPNELPLIHPYSDASDCRIIISAYKLEEIIAEKLRAILQRQHPRDIYDVWHLLKFYKNTLDLSVVKEVFQQKCKYKKVDFEGPNDFLKPELLASHRGAWVPSLARQVLDLPPFEAVEQDLGVLLKEFF